MDAVGRDEPGQVAQRQARFALFRPALGQPQRRFHFRRPDMLSLFQPFPQRQQRRLRHLGPIRPA